MSNTSNSSVYKVISTSNAPAALGPYSQGIRSGDFIFLAGQIGLVGNTGELIQGGIEKQTEQVLRNMEAILASQKLGLNSVIKTTVFLSDMNDFTAMNAVYAKFFHHDHPARSTVQVARLPKDALVEIEAVARAYVAE